MATTYRTNEEHKGIEIMFDAKPNEEVRASLKENGFRWHKQKKLWYAKETEERLSLAQRIADENLTADWTGETSDGYMGAIRWDGAKSGKHLYGAELSKAIREDLKKHGIKGCSVSVSTYSMGQSITVKVKCNDSDFIPYDEYRAKTKIYDFVAWNWLATEEDHSKQIHIDEYEALEDEEEKARIYEINAYLSYKAEHSGNVNHFHLDNYKSFTDTFMQKIENINNCILSYRYDDSNGMVDYFDTNFYYDIELKYEGA